MAFAVLPQVTATADRLYFNKYNLIAGNALNAMPKILPISVKMLWSVLLWSGAVRGAPLALGLLLLAAVCGTPLANGKPAKR